MTLTKTKLMEFLKLRYSEVDIPGLGKIGIRSVPSTLAERRDVMFNEDEAEFQRQWAWKLIDQVMVDEETPMFGPEDMEALQNDSDSARVGTLILLIDAFNAPDIAKKNNESEGSSDTGQSSSETPD